MGQNISSTPSVWPYSILGGFAIVILVNLVMVYLAARSHLGEFTENSYDKGLKYQDEIVAKKAFAKKDWLPKLAIESAPGSANRTLILSVFRKDGFPVLGLSGKVYAFRPSDKAMDKISTFQMTEPGIYRADFDSLPQGFWKLRVVLDSGTQELILEEDKIF